MEKISGSGERIKGGIRALLLAGVAFSVLTAPAEANIVINPTFGSSISGDANAAAIEATINSAINFYESNISTNITVNIGFGKGNGLGTSLTYIATDTYSDFITQLHAHSSGDATDTTALAGLPIQSNNPVTGTTITASLSNYNAIGITGFGTGGVDPNGACGVAGSNFAACILLNTALTTPGSPGSPGSFSLLAVAEHEMDEVLGLGSGLSCFNGTCTVGTPHPEDLFRWDGTGVRSYALNTQTSQNCTGASVANFSLNGAAGTNLKQFNNCNNGGDYGDWASGVAPPAVQDAFATAGSSPSLIVTSPEVVALDAIGYNLQAVPAPVIGHGFSALLAIGGLLFGAKLWKRNKKGMVAGAPQGSLALGS
jgi:hypothetical protein